MACWMCGGSSHQALMSLSKFVSANDTFCPPGPHVRDAFAESSVASIRNSLSSNPLPRTVFAFDSRRPDATAGRQSNYSRGHERNQGFRPAF